MSLSIFDRNECHFRGCFSQRFWRNSDTVYLRWIYHSPAWKSAEWFPLANDYLICGMLTLVTLKLVIKSVMVYFPSTIVSPDCVRNVVVTILNGLEWHILQDKKFLQVSFHLLWRHYLKQYVPSHFLKSFRVVEINFILGNTIYWLKLVVKMIFAGWCGIPFFFTQVSLLMCRGILIMFSSSFSLSVIIFSFAFKGSLYFPFVLIMMQSGLARKQVPWFL